MFENTKKQAAKKDEPVNESKPLPENDFLNESQSLEELPPVKEDYLQAEPVADYDKMFSELKGKKTNQLAEATSEYLKFDDWKTAEERDFIFTKKTHFTDESGQQVMAIALIDEQRRSFISGSKVLVESCLKIEKLPAAIRIKYNGKVKSGNNHYHSVNIFML